MKSRFRRSLQKNNIDSESDIDHLKIHTEQSRVILRPCSVAGLQLVSLVHRDQGKGWCFGPSCTVSVVEIPSFDILFQSLRFHVVTSGTVSSNNVDAYISREFGVLSNGVTNPKLFAVGPNNLSEMTYARREVWLVKVIITDLIIPVHKNSDDVIITNERKM